MDRVTTPNTPPVNKTNAHHWHLARTDQAVVLTDLEFALMRTYESFARWQTECLQAVTGVQLSGTENALLHVICMQERPKTIREIMQLTNRNDIPNIQYGLRKLIKSQFITKSGSAVKGVFYAGTPQGLKVCQDYAALREQLLLPALGTLASLDTGADASRQTLEQMEKVYESVTREAAAFHRRFQPE